jgi:hypothetical protein
MKRVQREGVPVDSVGSIVRRVDRRAGGHGGDREHNLTSATPTRGDRSASLCRLLSDPRGDAGACCCEAFLSKSLYSVNLLIIPVAWESKVTGYDGNYFGASSPQDVAGC